MAKYLRSLLLLSISFASLAIKAQEYGNENEWDAIDTAIAEQQWQRADSLLVATITANPGDANNALLLSNLGMVRYYAGNDSSAIVTLNAAHQYAPASVAILANRAKVLSSAGRFAEAIDDYNTIENLDSTYVDTYLYRGLLFLYTGDIESAQRDLTHRETLTPSDEDTVFALASLYSILDDWEKSSLYFSKLIQSHPTADFYAGRAMCDIRLGRLYDAAEDIADGLALDENNAELYLCRAILNKKRYCNNDSLADAERALALGANPSRVKALLNL